MSPYPKTTQKPTNAPPHISVNNGRIRTFQTAILCACTVARHMSHMNERFVHLGCGGAWWIIGNHCWIVFAPSIVLLCKLVIYCNYIWYILRTTDPLQKSWHSSFHSGPPTNNQQPTNDQQTTNKWPQMTAEELKYSCNRARRHQRPTNNLLEVWQNPAPFGGRPIGAAV